MGSISGIHPLKTFPEVYAFLREHGISKKSLPLRKSVHTLFRKKKCRCVVVERAPNCKEFQDECAAYGITAEARRFHFFSKVVKSEADLKNKLAAYSGYCDVRPDGSVAAGLIAQEVIIPPDTYSCLVCRITERLSLPDGSSVTVKGFPFVEKDGGIVMCSQAAIASVVAFWNQKKNGSFTATTGPEISKVAGVKQEEIKPNAGRGLFPQEIAEFFSQQKFQCYQKVYWQKPVESIRQANPGLTIYGFLESGFPVVMVVKTHSALHALTVVGHTFDKNAWPAIADPSYYNKPLSGYGYYHSNLTWIRHFIVQDDNLGPYYYLPTDAIPDIIAALFVALPFQDAVIDPETAESSAFVGFCQNHELLKKALNHPKMLKANRVWLEELLSYFDPSYAGGWVLRPILRQGKEIAQSYADSCFRKKVEKKFGGAAADRLYWRVEISWPDLFCFHESQAGEIVIDPQSKQMVMLRVPGVLYLFEQLSGGKIKPAKTFATVEDPPHLHERPSHV
jgi:hypothetical protein